MRSAVLPCPDPQTAVLRHNLRATNIHTVHKMLLLLPLLSSLSSFNCSLEAFSTLVAGIILSLP